MPTNPLPLLSSAIKPPRLASPAVAIRLALLLALLFIATLEAWLIDDAKITFRQVWNFIHGHGMTFNYGERVQAFTHPAWFFVLSAVAFVTRELFITTLGLSIVLSVAAVMLLLAAERRVDVDNAGGGGSAPLLTPALLLLFSVAFCDYMSSGLENPLSYFLVGLLLWLLAATGMDGLNGNLSHRRWIFIALALIVLNRFDYAALFLPLALVLTMASRGIRGFWHDVWPGALLLFGWLLFALIYFGSPLPNTFYAKMASGYPLERYLADGVAYFIKVGREDPISIVLIAAAMAVSLASGRRVLAALAVGQLLYLGFIIYAGGDWMPSGRFFAVPVLLAVGQLVLALAGRGRLGAQRRRITGGLLLLAVVFGLGPGQFPALSAVNHFNGQSRVNFPTKHFPVIIHPRGLLAMPRSRIADNARQKPTGYARGCYLGEPSLKATDIWTIDVCAIVDPFLARIPASHFKGPGHHWRTVPTNHGEYLFGRVDSLPDNNLNGLARDVALAARAPALFTTERFAAIRRLNSGYYAGLDLSKYQDRRNYIPLVSDDIRFDLRF